MIKILIADGHVVVASGIAQLLAEVEDFQVMGQAKNEEEIFYQLHEQFPDVVLLDVDLPGPSSGLRIVRQVQEKASQTRIIILTNLLNEEIIRDALRNGVTGYLLKNCSATELIQAVRSVYQDVPTLSPEVTRMLIREVVNPHNVYHLSSRELQVLELLAQGLSNVEIMSQLQISISTVQFHVSSILGKLGVHNRSEATAFAIRHKLVR